MLKNETLNTLILRHGDRMLRQAGWPDTVDMAPIITLMLKEKEPGDEFRALITVFAFLASAWYCVVQYRKEKGESQS